MPFDGANYPEPRPQPDPAKPSDMAVCLIILGVAFSMLVLPVSLQAFADVVKYLQRP